MAMRQAQNFSRSRRWNSLRQSYSIKLLGCRAGRVVRLGSRGTNGKHIAGNAGPRSGGGEVGLGRKGLMALARFAGAS